MPDLWEVQYGLDPATGNNNNDYDSDGLTDQDEYTNGTDPTDSDSDKDGMPDGWEVNYDLDPLAEDASDDADGDGFTNLKEYNAGKDPTDANSHPVRSMPWLPLLLYT